MNPYIMMLLQRAGASPAGQRGADILSQLRNFEGSRIPLIRGADGRYMPATAAQKIPLAPLTRGAAGLGAAGIVAADPTAPIRNAESLFAQLNEGRAQASPPTAPAPRESAPASVPRDEMSRIRHNLYNFYRDNDLSAADSIRQMDIATGMGMYDRVDPGAARRLHGAMLAAEPEPGYNYENAPLPPRRPTADSAFSGAPMPPRRPEAPAAESVLRRIFSGQDYQSNSRPVVESGRVNWGDPERAADFFRADRAARELGTLPPVERASGGQVGQAGQGGQGKPHKDAALVKALEIIERLMANGR